MDGRFCAVSYTGYSVSWIAHLRTRATLVLVLLCAVAVVQSAALTSEHEQHRSTDHGCVVCLVGTLPFLEPSTGAPLAPVLRIQWLESVPDFETANDARPTERSSRAPPV